jgi:hypothetical protein
MALYKEVQEYYDDGLKIPDDVTLLFSDDNFGSIRRLPTSDEAKRSGGVGVSYFPPNFEKKFSWKEPLLIVLVISCTTTSNTLVIQEATDG